MSDLSIEEYIRALEKMKRSPRDRIGILGELGVTGLGVTAGVALSGTVAAVAGAATIAGSTTLATLLGGVFVTTTPVGWVVGTAIAGGAVAYAAIQLVRSGAKCDTRRKMNISELEERIQKLRQEARNTSEENKKISKVITSIQHLVSNSFLGQDKATEVLAAIEKQNMSVDEAFVLLEAIANEKAEIEKTDAQQSLPADAENQRG